MYENGFDIISGRSVQHHVWVFVGVSVFAQILHIWFCFIVVETARFLRAMQVMQKDSDVNCKLDHAVQALCNYLELKWLWCTWLVYVVL